MSKYYDLQAVINGESHRYDKHFASRTEAINFIFKQYEEELIFNMQLEDEYELDNKHNREYVFDFNNRFFINRVIVA